MAARRIGLFGGSFDPVHHAHLALARSALATLDLAEVAWIPTGVAWQKARTMTPAAQRAEMVALAIAGEPRFRLERCELERAGPSYTLDTVLELEQREAGADWWLLLGQDQLERLHTWHRWRELVARVTLAIARRGGGAPEASTEVAVAARAIVEIPLPALDISASAIRERVEAGRGIDDMVPPAVASYIETHGLYRGPIRS